MNGLQVSQSNIAMLSRFILSLMKTITMGKSIDEPTFSLVHHLTQGRPPSLVSLSLSSMNLSCGVATSEATGDGSYS